MNATKAVTTGRRSNAGFTMIELMVVIAIITLAFGLMVPSITDFFHNRQLDLVRTQFNTTLHSARLQAVVNNRPFYVVFFREGMRIYDPKFERWKVDEEFDPERAPASDPSITFNLVFAGKHSRQIPRYLDWENAITGAGKNLKNKAAARKAEARRRSARSSRNPNEADEAGDRVPLQSIRGLVKIAFDRDGSLSILADGGQDVPAALYKESPPKGADIIIFQSYREGQDFNLNAAFIDLQLTGTVKSRVDNGAGVENFRLPPEGAAKEEWTAPEEDAGEPSEPASELPGEPEQPAGAEPAAPPEPPAGEQPATGESAAEPTAGETPSESGSGTDPEAPPEEAPPAGKGE